MRNLQIKVDDSGDTLSASDFNAQNAELENIITSADLTLDPAGGPDVDLDMLNKSVAGYANAGSTYQDSGIADAYVLSITSNLKSPTKYYDNMNVTFKAGNTNTGASTVNINSLGVKNITFTDGSNLINDTIFIDQFSTIIYSLSNDRFELSAILTEAADIKLWGSEILPSGWVECNGANYSRTSFAATFAVLGVRWGDGDGSTTFTIPDMRGKFPRGYDNSAGNDPDAISRGAHASGGNTGDNVGTIQDDASQRITGSIEDITATGTSALGVFSSVTSGTSRANGGDSQFRFSFDNANSISPAVSKTSNFETRPINATFMFILRLI